MFKEPCNKCKNKPELYQNGRCSCSCHKQENQNDLISCAEKIVILYANITGRDEQHRAEFRQKVTKILKPYF